jgi:hypothetical protein
MEASRKPLAKVEGRRRLKFSGLTVEFRGTKSLDDWAVYISGSKAKRSILIDRVSERRVKALLARIQNMSKREVERLAKG